MTRGQDPGRLDLRIGPFAASILSDAPGLLALARQLYRDHPGFDPGREFTDIRIGLRRRPGLRRWWRPQVEFIGDGQHPFHPFPLDHAYPMLEWGLNWAVASQAHQYLMFHAAVVARDDRAMLLPAQPGSGKSTLCTALIHRGWRLLSDEFGLLRPGGLEVTPIPRPIPLKNNSIELIRGFAPEAELGPDFPRTRKGRIAHVKPPAESAQAQHRPARLCWLVFPQYRAGARAELQPFPRGRAFLKLAGNAFNYKLQGEDGFATVARVVEECASLYFEFDDLEQAVGRLDRLADEALC